MINIMKLEVLTEPALMASWSSSAYLEEFGAAIPVSICYIPSLSRNKSRIRKTVKEISVYKSNYVSLPTSLSLIRNGLRSFEPEEAWEREGKPWNLGFQFLLVNGFWFVFLAVTRRQQLSIFWSIRKKLSDKDEWSLQNWEDAVGSQSESDIDRDDQDKS